MIWNLIVSQNIIMESGLITKSKFGISSSPRKLMWYLIFLLKAFVKFHLTKSLSGISSPWKNLIWNESSPKATNLESHLSEFSITFSSKMLIRNLIFQKTNVKIMSLQNLFWNLIFPPQINIMESHLLTKGKFRISSPPKKLMWYLIILPNAFVK